MTVLRTHLFFPARRRSSIAATCDPATRRPLAIYEEDEEQEKVDSGRGGRGLIGV